MSNAHIDIYKARAEAAEAINEVWRKNSRESFDAMVTMRNAINEHIPMPSLESDLLQGPETSVFCATVAQAVVSKLAKIEAELDMMKNAGIIEVAIRNPSVSDYMQHWEARAVAAEAVVEQLTSDPAYAAAYHVGFDNGKAKMAEALERVAEGRGDREEALATLEDKKNDQ